MNHFLQILIIVVSLSLLHSCAVQADPLGGPEDKIAPIPNAKKSTPNEQIFFKKQNINLVFDEWVKLKSPNQIIVSPPLEHGIQSKVKGKSVIISFDEKEELYENTTYTVNMGQAIVDYTADNPMANYTFVFSTGSYIDSLQVTGFVKDDYTGEPKTDMLVSMYDNMADTAIYTMRPLYFTRTDENGYFKISNVREDTFRIFAVDDKNLNYYKDQESEGLGFLQDSFYLDTAFVKPIELGFSLPVPTPRITDKILGKGYVRLGFNTFAEDIEYRFSPELEAYSSFILKDSFFLWYENEEERSLILNTSEVKSDTFSLEILTDSIVLLRKLSIKSSNGNLRKTLGPKDTLQLQFSRPILSFDQSKIILRDTSSKEKKYGIRIDHEDPRIMKIKSSWVEGQKHSVEFLPEALQTFGYLQKDTIEHDYVVSSSKAVGEIFFELDSLQKNYQYIVELKQGEKFFVQKVKNTTAKKIEFTGLKPGQYSVKIYEDVNRNGRWDGGDYKERRFSERWISKKLEALKANWTLEVLVNGSEFK